MERIEPFQLMSRCSFLKILKKFLRYSDRASLSNHKQPVTPAELCYMSIFLCLAAVRKDLKEIRVLGEIQIEPSGVPKALLLPAVVFVSVTAAQTSTWNSFKEKWEGSWDWPIEEIVILNIRNSGWFFVDTWTFMNYLGSSVANLGWKTQRQVPSSGRGGTHQLAPVWEIAPFQPGKAGRGLPQCLTGTEEQPKGLLVLLLHVEAGLLALSPSYMLGLLPQLQRRREEMAAETVWVLRASLLSLFTQEATAICTWDDWEK